jgi:predicted phage terminase large subunit-like protein
MASGVSAVPKCAQCSAQGGGSGETRPCDRHRRSGVIAHELEQCRLGATKRLIINLPPRYLKSHCASVAFPAWLLGHNPSAQIMCASYAQDLSDKHARDCRTVITSKWYDDLFSTRLSQSKQAVADFQTIQKGGRRATSIGGVVTGLGADFILIDDPLKPDDAISDVRRKAANEWYDHSLSSRLNNKRNGCIILIMQRLHEDDLTGHLLKSGDWKLLRLPAIAEQDEEYSLPTPFGPRTVKRGAGQPLDAQREPLAILKQNREVQGEYNFAGQYQQAPAPLGGGMIKIPWFKRFTSQTRPETFDFIFQSWDTANKTKELNDYSVCATFGVKGKELYLLHVRRDRLAYPELKRAVIEQRLAFNAGVILIEDKASGTQLIQELISDGQYGITRYETKMDKVMRMHSVTSIPENGLVYLPEQEPWLDVFLHELATFPRSRYDDQADSFSQALDWVRQRQMGFTVTFSTVYL